MKLDNNLNLPFDNNQPYVIRCLFFIEFTEELGFTSTDTKKDVKVDVNTDRTGDVRVFKGDGELLLDSTTSESSISSFQARGNTSLRSDVHQAKHEQHEGDLP